MLHIVSGTWHVFTESKPHPIELRERVAAFVDEGHGHREAVRHFLVSPKFVNDLMKLRRETGSLAPRRQGNGGVARQTGGVSLTHIRGKSV